MTPNTSTPCASLPRGRPSRRTWAWTAVGLAGAVGGVLLWQAGTGPNEPDPSDPSSEGTGLATSGRERTSGNTTIDDPFVPPTRPLTAAEAKRGLRSRLEALRIAALEEIVRRGVSVDPETSALLEEMASGPAGRVRALAQAALMKIEGSRRFLREIAERAGASEFAEFYADLATTVDPATGPALVKAFTAVRERASHPELGPVVGLEDAIATLAADRETGAIAISEALRSALPRDEPVWLDVAAAVKPVPSGVASLIAERIRAATPESGDGPYGFVLRNGIDLSAAPVELHDALAARLSSPTEPLRGASMRALGRLGTVDPKAIERIVLAARDGEQASYDALIALRFLGEKARPFAPQMIALRSSLSTTGQFLLAQALLATGGEGVGTYAAERLAGSNPSEHRAWLQGAALLAKAPDAPRALAAITRIAKAPDEDEARDAIGALARLEAAGIRDPAEKSPAEVLAEALSDPRSARRLAAVSAAAGLSSLPEAVAVGLARLADDADPTVRAAVLDVLAAAWRFGPEAKPLVPAALAALAALRRDGESAPKQSERVGLLRTIGAAAPSDGEVRKALFAALSGRTPEERLAGIHGLSRVAAPTADEKRAVAAAVEDPIERVRDIAREVLALPAWK